MTEENNFQICQDPRASRLRSLLLFWRVYFSLPDPLIHFEILTRPRAKLRSPSSSERFTGLSRFLLVFLVDRVFALSAREKCNMEAEEDVSLTSCYCQLTAEARDISKKGEKPHVHCPCEKCNDRATWRMTAWRHALTVGKKTIVSAFACQENTKNI